MTLVEKITKEIAACEKEIISCDTKIKIAETERTCYKNQLEMLTELLEKAQSETSEPITTETKPAKPVRKKKTSEATVSTSAETTDNNATISMTTLSKELGVGSNVIAQTCTDLGYNEEMMKNNYLLTAEQAENVKYAISGTRETQKG